MNDDVRVTIEALELNAADSERRCRESQPSGVNNDHGSEA
jgi:hypothetical protein